MKVIRRTFGCLCVAPVNEQMAWISFRLGHLRLDVIEEADEVLMPGASCADR